MASENPPSEDFKDKVTLLMSELIRALDKRHWEDLQTKIKQTSHYICHQCPSDSMEQFSQDFQEFAEVVQEKSKPNTPSRSKLGKLWLKKLKGFQQKWEELCQIWAGQSHSAAAVKPDSEFQSTESKPTKDSTRTKALVKPSYADVIQHNTPSTKAAIGNDHSVPKTQNTRTPKDSHFEDNVEKGESVSTFTETKVEQVVARAGENAQDNDGKTTGGEVASTVSTGNTTGSLPYRPQSKHWASQMKDLAKMRYEQRKQVGSLHICTNRKEFEVEKGTFLGIKWDGKETEGTEVAVKRLPKSGDTYKGMKNEYELLRWAYGCENIIRYMYYTEDDTYAYLATELWEYTLRQYTHKTKFTEGLSKKDVFCKVINGLQSLHAHDILHRDITPDNVVIDVHDRVLLKGFQHTCSCDIEKGQMIPSKTTESCWQAQETMDSKDPKWYKASDIFAAGLIGHHIETEGAHHPFGSHSDSSYEKTKHIMQGRRCNLRHIKDLVATPMLEWMLLPDHDNRPTSKMVLNHPYFWDTNKRLQFLVDLGNEPEVEHRTKCDVLDGINTCSTTVSEENWTERLERTYPNMMYEMKQHRTYKNTNGDLLRFTRNFKQHKKDLQEDTYFTAKKILTWFPNLLPCVYDVVIKSSKSKDDWTKREYLQKYFS